MANSIYNNLVLEDAYESVLATALDYQQFMTIDNSLTTEAGNIKRVIKHTVVGSTEDLAMGVGNSGNIEVKTTYEDYPCLTTQGRFAYYDEEAAADGAVVDGGIKGLSEKMVNDLTAKAIAELDKAVLEKGYSTVSFDDFVDAIALANRESTDGWYILINPGMEGKLRKAFNSNIQYVEAFIRSGYIGHICGIPVYVSKGVPNDTAYIASPEAVKCFIKKGTEIENERDANTRKNTVYARKVACVALVDDAKVVKLAKSVATACTVTTGTKDTKTIGGAAATGSTVEIYLNGALVGTATAASNAYSFTNADNLVAGDKIVAIAKLTGYVSSTSSEFTVAS